MTTIPTALGDIDHGAPPTTGQDLLRGWMNKCAALGWPIDLGQPAELFRALGEAIDGALLNAAARHLNEPRAGGVPAPPATLQGFSAQQLLGLRGFCQTTGLTVPQVVAYAGAHRRAQHG